MPPLMARSNLETFKCGLRTFSCVPQCVLISDSGSDIIVIQGRVFEQSANGRPINIFYESFIENIEKSLVSHCYESDCECCGRIQLSPVEG